ncbi:WD40 repeat domain-containing protein [Streptosporangium sp. CA-135522]|uniref:WD40 repeat domain-containing protein n=1 Tax=Streptosporangium sp. CA-135522 TaxID=3240072 RepID=UPI003D8B50CC
MTALDELFYRPLVQVYTDDDPRHVERTWLTGVVTALAAEPSHRIVLVTGEPGAGKSALAAALCRDNPAWLRYFVRRDSRSPLSAVDARSLLLTLGHQLAATRPELFDPAVQITVDQRVGKVHGDASVTGVRIENLQASPFLSTSIKVTQAASRVDGTVTGVDIKSATLEPHMLDVGNLQALALGLPAGVLARTEPGERIVIVIDAVDDVRYHGGGSDSILTWLASCGTLPHNIMIVVTSRHDPPLLQRLRQVHGGALAELNLDAERDRARSDIDLYVGRLVGEAATSRLLAEHAISAIGFRGRVVAKADGNFQYVTAIGRAMDAAGAHPQLAGLLRDLDDLPPTLDELYAYFLGLIRDCVGRTSVEVGEEVYLSAWTALYLPLLGILSAARAPLTPRQLADYGGIRATPDDVDHALDLLSQFLHPAEGGLTLYHASFADFLAAGDGERWHRKIVAVARAGFAADWAAMDDYARFHLPFHAAVGAELDALLDDLGFVVAADPDGLIPFAADAVSDRARAVGESFQIAYRQARGRPEEERAAFLALAARQLGQHEVAAAADRLSQGGPWSIRWIKRLSEPVIQHVAYHEDFVTALACARFGDRTLVVSAANRSKRLLVHDLETSDLLDTILLDHVGYNVTALAAFSLPSGLLVAAGDCDGTIQVFSADQHIVADTELRPHDSVITSLDFLEVGDALLLISADDRRRVASTALRGSPSLSMPAVIEADEGSRAQYEITASGLDRDNPKHPTHVSALLRRGVPVLASTTNSRYAQLTELNNGTGVTRVELGQAPVCALAGGWLQGRQVLVAAAEGLAVHDLETGEKIAGLDEQRAHVTGSALAAASSPEEPLAVVFGNSYGDICVWRPEGAGTVGEAEWTQPIVALSAGVSDGGGVLLVAHNDNWLRGPGARVSQDEDRVNDIEAFDSMTGEFIETIAQVMGAGGISDFTLLDGRLIISSIGGPELLEIELSEPRSQRLIDTGLNNICSVSAVSTVGGGLIATATTRDALISIFEAASGELAAKMPTLEKGRISALDLFEVNGGFALLAGFGGTGGILFLDLGVDPPAYTMIDPGYAGHTVAVRSLVAGNTLLVCSGDQAGQVRILNLSTRRIVCSFGLDSPVTDLCFTTDLGLAVSTRSGLTVVNLHFLSAG